MNHILGNQQTFNPVPKGLVLLGICALLLYQCALLTYRIEDDPANDGSAGVGVVEIEPFQLYLEASKP